MSDYHLDHVSEKARATATFPKRLVINADDFGLTKGVSAGIAQAMLHGVVSSTSAMACRPGTGSDLEQWGDRLAGQIGVHLQLTDGEPCADPSRIRTLVNADGRFPRLRRDLKKMKTDEIRTEWHAQMEKMLAAGLKPSHLDTHHHVHKAPAAFEVYCEIAKTYDIPARTVSPWMTEQMRAEGITCAAYCETGWHKRGLTAEGLLGALEMAFDEYGDQGAVELMCHPAFVDEELACSSNYVEEREEELRLLCSPELMKLLRESGIEVIRVSDLDRLCAEVRPDAG